MKRMLLSLRVILPVLVLLFTIIQLSGAYFTSRNALLNDTIQDQKQVLQTRLNIVQSAMEVFQSSENIDAINQLTSSLSATPDMVQLLVTDNTGKIVSSNHVSQVGLYWNQLDTQIQQEKVNQILNQRTVIIAHKEGRLDGYTSYCFRQQHTALEKPACGFIYYQMDLNFHFQQLEYLLQYNTIYNLIAASVAVLMLLLAVHLMITNRTLKLIQTLKRYIAGHRKIKAPVQFNDEITALGEQINQLFTHINATEQELQDREQRLDTILNTVPDGILITDPQGIILRANPAISKMLQYQTGDLMGTTIKTLLPETFKGSIQKTLDRLIAQNTNLGLKPDNRLNAQRKDQSLLPIEATFSQMTIKEQSFYIAVFRDVSLRAEMEIMMRKVNEKLVEANKKLSIQADTDGLTQLANRMHFDRVFHDEIQRTRRQKSPICVLMCDVDYFKDYNDFYGHQAGDEVLKQVASMLSSCFKRSGELVARYGGEEFVAVLPSVHFAHARFSAQQAVDKLNELAIKHERSAISDHLTISIGIASFDGKNVQQLSDDGLLKLADDALYQAKEQGRNRVVLKHWPSETES